VFLFISPRLCHNLGLCSFSRRPRRFGSICVSQQRLRISYRAFENILSVMIRHSWSALESPSPPTMSRVNGRPSSLIARCQGQTLCWVVFVSHSIKLPQVAKAVWEPFPLLFRAISLFPTIPPRSPVRFCSTAPLFDFVDAPSQLPRFALQFIPSSRLCLYIFSLPLLFIVCRPLANLFCAFSPTSLPLVDVSARIFLSPLGFAPLMMSGSDRGLWFRKSRISEPFFSFSASPY